MYNFYVYNPMYSRYLWNIFVKANKDKNKSWASKTMNKNQAYFSIFHFLWMVHGQGARGFEALCSAHQYQN